MAKTNVSLILRRLSGRGLLFWEGGLPILLVSHFHGDSFPQGMAGLSLCSSPQGTSLLEERVQARVTMGHSHGPVYRLKDHKKRECVAFLPLCPRAVWGNSPSEHDYSADAHFFSSAWVLHGLPQDWRGAGAECGSCSEYGGPSPWSHWVYQAMRRTGK